MTENRRKSLSKLLELTRGLSANISARVPSGVSYVPAGRPGALPNIISISASQSF